MIVRKMREQRGWSQEQLAELSGLSVRTIQRIEKGKNAEVESLRSLAAVFETQLSEIQQGIKTIPDASTDLNEEHIKKYVKAKRVFFVHLGAYFFVVVMLFATAMLAPGDANFSEFNEVAFGWGIAVFLNLSYLLVLRYRLLNKNWEKNQVKEIAGR